jgi:hypothetical protein
LPRARKKKERKVLNRRGTKVIERQSAAAGSNPSVEEASADR